MQNERDLFIKSVFSTVAPYIDLLTTAFSFGFCRLWRKKVVKLAALKEDEDVLDICTGTGELAFMLLEHMGDGSSFHGVDFCQDMLQKAVQKTRDRYSSASFHLSDAKDLPFEDRSFDLVTVSFGMRNIPDTALALNEVYRVLRPGGRFICLELTRPVKKWFLPLYKLYTFRIMPWVANMIVKSRTPYTYLPRSIEAFYAPDDFVGVIAETGFTDVNMYSMSMGVATVFWARKSEQD